MKAEDYLKKAADIMAERGKQYDKPEGERSMDQTIQAFNAITGRDLSEAEGWLLMDCLKSVRLFQRPGFHADSAEDKVAYASLLAEAKEKEKTIGHVTFATPQEVKHIGWKYGAEPVNNWTDWNSPGKCPVPPNTRISIKFQSGLVFSGTAISYPWDKNPPVIKAYRIL